MKRRKPKFPLYQQIIVAVIAGVLYGIFLPGRVHLVAWMGDIFLRLLKEGEPSFLLKLVYEGDSLKKALLNGDNLVV